MLPIQPQPPPNAPTTIAKVLFTVTGKETLLFPATSRPHCFYIPPQNIYPPGIVAAEEFFRTHEVLFLLLTAS